MWPSFCFAKFGERFLSRFIESSRPHQLPDIEFDDKFDVTDVEGQSLSFDTDSISSRSGQEQKTMASHLQEMDEEEEEWNEFQHGSWKIYRRDFCGLIRLSRSMFVSFLSDIKSLPGNRSKILFVDRESSLMLNRTVHWLELKKAGVGCVFVLDDQKASDLLTSSCDVIYLLAMASRDGNEFKILAKELQQRSRKQMHVYVCGPCDLHDPFEKKQLQIFAQLGQSRCKLLEIWPIVAERVALIDNATENIRFLLFFVRFPCERDLLQPDGPVTVHLRALAHKLAHLLDTCGILPHVRYQDTFHGLGKWLAKMTFERIAEKRKQTGSDDEVRRRGSVPKKRNAINRDFVLSKRKVQKLPARLFAFDRGSYGRSDHSAVARNTVS
jgi:hypothetical protein